MKITKQQVLKALETEPLKRGQWVDRAYLNYIGDCNVCAVGAVLRQAGLTNREIYLSVRAQSIRSGCEDPNQTVKTDPLTALSEVFETKGKKAAIEFVKKKFPKTITLSDTKLRKVKHRIWKSIENYLAHNLLPSPPATPTPIQRKQYTEIAAQHQRLQELIVRTKDV